MSRNPDDDQLAAIELIDAFSGHDREALAGLTVEQRAEQVQARRRLYGYVDDLWEGAKARGVDPANLPEWSVVAGVRDLTSALWEQAQYDTADET